MENRLRAPLAKIKRTEEQIFDFNTRISKFISEKTYDIEVYGDPDNDIDVWRFRFDQIIPDDISVIVGEIFHNLRSSIDQTVVEICMAHGSKSEYGISFPFGNSIDDFELSLSNQKKIPQDFKSYIRTLRPYLGGNDLLWILHETNKRDKHRIGLVPVNMGVAGRSSFLSVWYGQMLSIGPRTGQHLIVERNITSFDYISLALKGEVWGAYGMNLINLSTGLPDHPNVTGYIHYENYLPLDIENSFEFATSTPGSAIITDFQPSFNVSLDTKGIVRGTPIVNILSNIHNCVKDFVEYSKCNFF